MNKISTTVGAVSLFISAILPAQEYAAPSYIVGIEDTRYLPQYDHDGDQLLGYAREFLDEFARQYQIKLEYRTYPVNRLYHVFFVEQMVDFKYPDDPGWRPELRGSFSVHYSAPCAEFIDGVLVLPARKGNGVAQLKRLGMMRGFTPVEYQKRIQQGLLEIDETGSISGLLQMGLRGRVDGVYLNVAVARFQLEQSLRRADALVFDPDLPYYRGGYSLSTIKYPERIKEMNEFISRNPEWIKSLKQRYGIAVE